LGKRRGGGEHGEEGEREEREKSHWWPLLADEGAAIKTGNIVGWKDNVEREWKKEEWLVLSTNRLVKNFPRIASFNTIKVKGGAGGQSLRKRALKEGLDLPRWEKREKRGQREREGGVSI